MSLYSFYAIACIVGVFAFMIMGKSVEATMFAIATLHFMSKHAYHKESPSPGGSEKAKGMEEWK